MKKAVSVMLSLLVLGATFFTSCSVDSDDGGGREPALDACFVDENGNKLESLKLSYAIGETSTPVFSVKSDAYGFRLTFVKLVCDNNDVEFFYRYDSEKKLFKILIQAVPNTPGEHPYTLFVNYTDRVEGAQELSFTVSVSKPKNPVQPYITTQPQSQSVTVGSPFTLSVEASAEEIGELSYQWYKDGNEISGAIQKDYKKDFAQKADSGTYYVTVTNKKDEKTLDVDSDKVTVTVSEQGESGGTGSAGGDFNFGQ